MKDEETVAQDEGTEKTPEELRADIEQTREEMGDTVEALADKTDVKGQAQDKVADAKTQAQAKVTEVKQRVTGKRDELKTKAREGGPDSFDPEQAKTLAKENPVPVAVGALTIAFLLGRLTKRR